MKKIICFVESMAGGGAEHQMAILCNLLIKNGYEVTLTTYADLPDHYTLSQDIKRKRLQKTSNRLVKLFAIFWYFLFVDADCVISFRQACNARALIPLFFRSKIKVICSERNFSGQGPGFYEKLLFGFLYNRANVIVCNSFSQSDYIIRQYPRFSDKTVTIFNYANLSHYKPIPNNNNSDVTRIAIFARFSKQKNCMRFAKAISDLKTQVATKFEIHWYGNSSGSVHGFSQEFLELKEYLNKSKMRDYFFIHAPVNDTASYIIKYDAICLPSLYEGFSNSIAEAICCGMPMLVSEVSDNKIMVHEGENGFLFNPKDEKSIVCAFVKFLDLNEMQRSKMKRCSREIAEGLFGKSIFINNYIKLIENGENRY